jgi:hypothetical protein
VSVTSDFKPLNKAIMRTRYPTKTIADVLLEINGSTVFSKLDILNEFNQLMLAFKSVRNTTNTTYIHAYSMPVRVA